jgi:hypothetical protein
LIQWIRNMASTWTTKRKEQRKRRKERVKLEQMYMQVKHFPMPLQVGSLFDLMVNQPVVKPAQEGKKMYDDFEPDGYKPRNYLHERANEVYGAKDLELRSHFHLSDDPPPNTWEEFVSRIKDGKVTVDEKYAKKRVWYWTDMTSFVRFRDPKAVEDTEGYEKAHKHLQEYLTGVVDTIVVKTPEDGLRALNKFEEKTFH